MVAIPKTMSVSLTFQVIFWRNSVATAKLTGKCTQSQAYGIAAAATVPLAFSVRTTFSGVSTTVLITAT